MRTVVLLILIVVQVLLFRTIEGTTFDLAGGAALWYVTWFIDAVQAWSPLLLIALGMCLAISTRGVDLSMPAVAALAAAIMSRFAPGDFFTIGVPLAALVGLAAGGVNGAAVRFGGFRPLVVTLIVAAVCRAATWFIVDPSGGSFGLIDGYERLGYFEGAITVTLVLYAAFGLVMWLAGRRFLEQGWSGFLLIGVLAFFAAFLHTALHMEATAWSMAAMQVPALGAALLAGIQWRSGKLRPIRCLLATFNIILLMRGMQTLALHFALTREAELAMQYGAVTLLIVAILLARTMRLRQRPLTTQ